MRPFGCLVTILNTKDHLGKFNGKVDESFFVGYSSNSKAFRVSNTITKIMEENLHIRFSESIPNVVGSGPDWLFDIDALTRTMNYEPIVAGSKPSSDDGKKVDKDPRKESECKDQEKEDNVNSTNNVNAAGINRVNVVGEKISNELPFDLNKPALEDIRFEDPNLPDRVYKVKKALYGLHQALSAWYETLLTYLLDNGFQRGKTDKTLFTKRHKGDILLVQVYVDDIIFGSTKKELYNAFEKLMHEKFQMSSMGELTFFLGLQVKQKNDNIFISQDKYFAKILNKFRFIKVKNASTPMETQKPLLKDEDGKEVDVHMYRSMIGSLMYPTSSRPDIIFAVCACARYQVNSKVSHLHAMKRIFRIGKGFFGKITPLFPTMVVQSLMGEGSALPTDPQHTLIILQPSSSQHQKTHKPRKPKRKDTQVPQLSVPTESVADEAVYKELDDRLVGAATTTSSLEAEHDSSKKPWGILLLKLGLRLYLNNLVIHSSQEEKKKTTQANEIASLKRRVKKLERRNSLCKDTSKQERRIDYIDDDEDITLENVQNDVEMFDADKDLGGEEVFVEQEVVADKEEIDEVNLAQALAKLKTSKAKAKGIVLQEPSESTTTTTKTISSKQKSQDKGKGIMVEEPVKLKKKDQIKLDEEATLRLQAEFDEEQRLAREKAKKQLVERMQAQEQEELTDAEKATLFMQLLKKRKKFFAAKKAKEKRNKPPTQAQKREIMVNTFKDFRTKLVQFKEKRAGEELIQKKTKKQKVVDDKETSELKQLMEIIREKEEVAIDAIALAVKSLRIVNWKIYKEGKKSYYQIIRADGKS
nr:putative ribonuclease H-like domain-containing protein [Tanacetum cinerariifolium]